MSQHPKNIIKQLIYVVFISIAVPFLLSFLNFLHPLFDSYSHFRIHLLLLLIPTMLLLAFFHEIKNLLIYLLLVLLASLYLYYLNQPFKPQLIDQDKNNTIKHIQFNLLFSNSKMDKVINYFKESQADVITLQEVTEEHRERLEELTRELYSVELQGEFPYLSWKEGAYPYQAYCEFHSIVGAVAILSKHPFNDEKSVCLQGEGLQWSQIFVKKEPVNIVSIHTHWPYPYAQAEQIQYIKPIFKHISSPMIISGDFNAASWSHTVKEIEKHSDTKVIDGLRWTISLKKQVPFIPNFKLAIDHILVSKEFQVKNIFVDKELGSDHLPVVTVLNY
ncbi:MAG: Endonuclease/exonuclease/phosphatase [uncultured Sulfurovum sp.]|uniref:Endonuclease/exonuclease/phosphatase n=1 Tax=uncultured Sulfurovum sp. TaxID=269237 RepID=A0A6S6S9D8_9BACT|nr:MAG: Endonuclease/exonuclease/phosphatase [uncultured Sulfurovum sp.]